MTNPFAPPPGEPYNWGHGQQLPGATPPPAAGGWGAGDRAPAQRPSSSGFTGFGAAPQAPGSPQQFGGPSPFDRPAPIVVPKATGIRGRPDGVMIAIVCLVASACLSVYQLVRVLTVVNEVSEDARGIGELDPSGVRSAVTNGAVDEASGVAITGSVLFTVLAVACFLVFTWFIWRGAPWPRIAAVPLAVLAVIFGVIGGEPIAVTIVALCVVATACLWLPGSVRFTEPVSTPTVFGN